MSITKIAKMTTEITADYQKLSDLNVAFYNQDINTSILQFDVTRNNVPVPLGKVNVDGYIVLLAADGSRIQDAVKIVDELKGVIEYTIPREFLKRSGKVLGQIYIAVKGKDDTAVMRQFSFDVKNDLLTGFSAEIKLEYIKTFYDLERIIYGRVKAIDEAITNGEDYVTAMQKAADKGKQDMQAVATKATTDVNKAATDATKNITDTSNTAVATVNAKGDEVLKKLTDGDVVQKKDYYPLISGAGIRTKLADGTDLLTLKTGCYEVAKCKNSPFPDTEESWKNIDVIDGGAGRKMLRLTVSNRGDTFYKTLHTNSTGGRDWWQAANTSDLQPLVKSSDTDMWQKQKIWDDDGSTITIKNYDLLNTTDVSNFDGYSNTAINMPAGVHRAGYIKRKNREGFIEVTYSPYNLNTAYRNSYNPETEVWTGWVQFANQTDVTALKGSDTGWVTYNTINGVLANAAFKDSGDNGYNCAYRKTTANGITRLLLRVNISNITAETVIFANLPNGIVVNSQMGVARTNGADQKTVVTLRPSGDLSINVPSGFTVKAYVYHQFEWTL